MASNNKKDEKISELKDQLNRIQSDHGDIDINKYLATTDDLPDLGDIEIYNYNKDIVDSKTKADTVLTALADLYLGDDPNILKHPYIKLKMEEDANIYAETIFLQKMSKKNYISQLKQIDNGDNSARMHEVVNQSANQIRENIKFTTTLKTDMESFYKTLRKDLGMTELSEVNEDKIAETSEDKPDKIFDPRDLNNMIDNALKKDR